jgi:hypothetical protein
LSRAFARRLGFAAAPQDEGFEMGRFATRAFSGRQIAIQQFQIEVAPVSAVR